MTDSIIYIVHELPGGQDGMDRDAKGGPVQAYLSKEDAEKYVGRDSRYKIEPKVVDLVKEAQECFRLLNPLQKLLMTTVKIQRSKSFKGGWNFSLCLK